MATLKTTVYRTSQDSALAPALIEAAENGKQSVCIVELKARFDEQRNIEWARSLEQAGVHVVYGFPDMKIHAKTTLVIRARGRRPPALRPHRHRQLPRHDGAALRGRRPLHRRPGHRRRHRRPLQLRHRLRPPAGVPEDPRRAVQPAPASSSSSIRAVAAAAAAGEHARIRIKVNNLTDPAIVEELYRASQAGRRDRPDHPRRSACSARASRASSERIRVRSILGRFLEHSRLYCFEAGDERSYLLGSADLMQRNLDHRIEVVVPVEAAHVRAEIETIFRRLLADNSQAWLMARTARGSGRGPSPASGAGRPSSCAMRGRDAGPAPNRAGGVIRPTCGPGMMDPCLSGSIDVGLEHGPAARRPRRRGDPPREGDGSGSARRSSGRRDPEEKLVETRAPDRALRLRRAGARAPSGSRCW